MPQNIVFVQTPKDSMIVFKDYLLIYTLIQVHDHLITVKKVVFFGF